MEVHSELDKGGDHRCQESMKDQFQFKCKLGVSISLSDTAMCIFKTVIELYSLNGDWPNQPFILHMIRIMLIKTYCLTQPVSPLNVKLFHKITWNKQHTTLY